MTRLEALKELAEKVEAGADIAWGFGADPSRIALPVQWENAFNAYCGSLDAAQALHEAVLSEDHQWVIGSFRDGRRFLTFDGTIEASNPARAWLLAILRALIAKEQNDDL